MGQSVNISSSGLLFESSEPLETGQTVEACVAWPVVLDQRVPLNLVIKGSVVRHLGDLSAVRFATHQLRTRGAEEPVSDSI